MKKEISIWDKKIITQALIDSIKKLNPRKMLKNPVMFVVEVGAAFLTLKLLVNIFVPSAESNFGFEIQITLWLWFTVLFANFAEAMAEGRGKAQADTLRKAKTETSAKRLKHDGTTEIVSATELAEKVMSFLSKQANLFPATAKLSKASRRLTNRQLRANPRRSFVNRAATVRL